MRTLRQKSAVSGLIFFIFCISVVAESATNVNPLISKRWLSEKWTARWSMHDSDIETDKGVYLFRKNIELASAPDRFVVHVSADQRYQLFVNGEQVVWGPARGDVFHWRFETVDIAPYLEAGKNIIAARVWSFGNMAPWAQMTVQTAFILQGDGSAEQVLDTPYGWKSYKDESVVPFQSKMGVDEISCVTGPAERVKGELHPWGWNMPGFDDSAWNEVIAIDNAYPAGIPGDASSLWHLVPRNIPFMELKLERFPSIPRKPKVKVTREFLKGEAPVVVPAKKKTSILFDRKQITNGFPEIIVSGGKGSKMSLVYEEALYKYPEATVGINIKGNRDKVKGQGVRVGYKFDEFFPEGGDHRLYTTLWWRSFRYVQLNIETGDEPLVIEDIRIKATGYPFEQVAEFDSNDPLMKKIWQVGWRTVRMCSAETFMDCPYYEQLQYVGDTRIQSMVSLYVSGDDRLMRNAIELFYESIIPEGITRSRYPSRVLQIIPTFSLQWVGMVHDFWMHRDDDEFVKQYMVSIYEVLDWFEKHRRDDGLLGGLEWWNFVDWVTTWKGGVPPGATEGGSSVVSLEYALALMEAAKLEDDLGSSAIAADYRKRADKIIEAVRKHCWDDGRGLVADTPEKGTYSQHATLMAVLAGMVPEDQTTEVMERALADPDISKCTYQFRYFLHRAIEKAGLSYKYTSFLGPWRNMLDLGLTTWAESPEPTRSDCHGWSAAPTYDMLAVILGIKPSASRFSSVRIEPHMSGLEWVKGKIPHPKGMLSVSISEGSGGASAEIEMPAGLPGVFVWNGKEYPLSPGLQKLDLD
ncbi:MAG TPA: alpha-L-rhamnosidase [bacterium]|nr:alpha-L-rhamnosidase [bacterium]